MDATKQHEPSAEVDQRYPNTPIGIVRSRDAFLRDLPALLANPKYDRWCIAYCGEERIALAESQEKVHGEIRRRGLHQDEYFIGCIFPHGEDNEEVEFGVFEFEEVDEKEDGGSVVSPNGPGSVA